MAKSLDDVRELCAIQAGVLERFLDEAIEDTQGKFDWQGASPNAFIRVRIEHNETVPSLVLAEVIERYMAAGGWQQVDCHWANGKLTLDLCPEEDDAELE